MMTMDETCIDVLSSWWQVEDAMARHRKASHVNRRPLEMLVKLALLGGSASTRRLAKDRAEYSCLESLAELGMAIGTPDAHPGPSGRVWEITDKGESQMHEIIERIKEEE